MVFCGKPSKGCTNCRIRRIKCDQADPACSQCRRAGKDCSGYRDQLNLLFRDESDKIVRKAHLPKQTSEQKKRSRGQVKLPEAIVEVLPSGSDDDNSYPYAIQLQSPASSSPPSITSPSITHDEGIKFFFQHFVTIISQDSSGGVSMLSSPLWPLLFINKSLANAVSSVGYAALFNVTKEPGYMVIASKKYAANLKDVTQALTDTSKADLESTFKSILLLAAFEIVNGPSSKYDSSSWGAHIEGGVAILKMIEARKPQDFPAPRMQIQILFSLFVKCLSRGERAPSSNHSWAKKIRSHMKPIDAPATTLIDIIYNIINLCAEVGKPDTSYTPDRIVQEALAIDHELEEWNTQLPSKWRWKVKKVTEMSKYTYDQHTHEYHDLWTSRVYGNYRWSRILVNELLIVYTPPSPSISTSSDNTSQNQRSLALISQLATEICTSVSSQFKKYTIMQAIRNKVPPMTGCFMLLLPLAIAGSGIGVSEELHEWSVGMLEVIGGQMGVSQALAMVPLVKRQRARWIEGYAGRGYRILSERESWV